MTQFVQRDLVDIASASQAEMEAGTEAGLRLMSPLRVKQAITAGAPVTPSVGVGQTWQNVTASRAQNVTYTNSTGKPIVVVVSVYQTGNVNVIIWLTVDGVVVGRDASHEASGTLGACITAIVPNGSTYIASNQSGTLTWTELR